MTTERKARTIKITREEVYKDIDSLTYKYAEASTTPTPKIENAISSDSTERLDGRILARNVEYRDAKLRGILESSLVDDVEIGTATDVMPGNDAYIIYALMLPCSYKDALLQALAVLIHRYLVWGALYDWYGAGMGSQQAKVYQKEIDDLEAEIHNKINSVNVVKRPGQPWGPIRNIRL